MLQAGDRAPDFTLADHDGRPVRLADLLRQGPLILYFYPADFTPGCTSEACAVRDLHDELIGAGLRVVGVSPQDSATHARFRTRHDLPFPLLADTDKRVFDLYGAKGSIPIRVKRSVFVIDGEGVVRWAHLSPVGLTYQDVETITAVLKSL